MAPRWQGALLRPVIDWMFPYQNYTKTLIRQLGLQEAVHYTGPLNEQAMCEQYLHSSLYVLCSSMENSPNSLGEAMLLGMPCVASAMGGVSSLLTHEREGLLYPSEDENALAAAILALLEDPARARQLGKAARARVTHDPEKMRRICWPFTSRPQAGTPESRPAHNEKTRKGGGRCGAYPAGDRAGYHLQPGEIHCPGAGQCAGPKDRLPFEIYVSEDCGTDGTRDILKEYAHRYPQIIRLNLREKNVGISRNWYEGLCAARGRLLCTLEGDDWWLDDHKLQKQVDFCVLTRTMRR